MTRSVLLIIGGGIAAYKSLELIRLLKGKDIGVRAIMTKAAQEFVTPLVGCQPLWREGSHRLCSPSPMKWRWGTSNCRAQLILLWLPLPRLIFWPRWRRDLPMTWRPPHLLATDKQVLVAPAMNVRMWQHAATQRNIRALKNDGIHFVGPNEGEMACGEFGPGRMAEPAELLQPLSTCCQPQRQTAGGQAGAGHGRPDARAD